MRGSSARLAARSLHVDPFDEVVAVGRLVIVMTVDARVRHALIYTPDEGILIGDARNVDTCTTTCLRCGRIGHRSGSCTNPGVQMSPRIARRRYIDPRWNRSNV